MQGQWIGKNDKGTNRGLVVLDLDDCGDHYEGSAYLFDENQELHHTHAIIKTKNKSNTQNLTKVPLYAINNTIPEHLDSSQLDGQYLAETADITLSLSGNQLEAKWQTVYSNGELTLSLQDMNAVSTYKSTENISSWSDFKKLIEENAHEYRNFIYRGQKEPWKLRTSFHRTNRSDLYKYQNNDLSEMNKAVYDRLGKGYDFNDPYKYASFIHLLQHYGYPTPLLDWTYSPYIAVFFAFANQTNTSKDVRIFMLDAKRWKQDTLQINHLTLGKPHITILEPYSHGNERSLPQQSLATITNIDDIEGFISSYEKQNNETYLRVFDLPASERDVVLNDLAMMGITHATLFPGLDGLCADLKEQNFK